MIKIENSQPNVMHSDIEYFPTFANYGDKVHLKLTKKYISLVYKLYSPIPILNSSKDSFNLVHATTNLRLDCRSWNRY